MFAKKDLSSRVWMLDELRGIFILLMVLYHLFYDLVYIFGLDIPVFHWAITGFIQLLIAGLFVCISGIASRYSHSNFKRGAQCFAFGMAMTLVTWIFLPSQLVVFGVLHLLGVCMLLFPLLRPLLDKIPPWLGMLCCAALFLLTFNTQSGYWGMGALALPLPAALYKLRGLFFLGFPDPTFFSSDYFPLLPWFFWFFGGTFAGVYVKEGRCPAFFYRPHSRVLGVLGRNTIFIYLLHQPVVYGILYVIFSLLR